MALPQPAPAPTPSDDPSRVLSSAIAQNRLRLAFQPVVSARRPGQPAFWECLARIVQADGRVCSAGALIAATECSDLGRLLDRTVLRLAIEALRQHPGRRLSVNISAAGVGDQDWLALLRAAEEETPGVCDWLIIEITETASLTLDRRALEFLFELRDMGASLALDDFGSGHTSLRQLGKFRFDFLKIDASLCVGVARSDDAQRTFASVLRIAQHFDLITVAEGLEDAEDVDALIEAGVDCLQGYIFGRPELSLTLPRQAEQRDGNGAPDTDRSAWDQVLPGDRTKGAQANWPALFEAGRSSASK